LIERRQNVEHLLGTLHDPDRLAAPLEHQALAFGQFADVGGHRRTGELRAGAGIPGLDERHRRNADTDGADHGGRCGQEPATALVDGFTVVDMSGIVDPYPNIGHPTLRSKALERCTNRPCAPKHASGPQRR